MAKSRYSKKKRLEILTEHDAGASIKELARKYQLSEGAIYQWKRDKVTDEDENLSRLKELEDENKRLKKMYSELSINHDILKQGYGMLKKWEAQNNKK